MRRITILTLFPDMVNPVLAQSILGRAIQSGHLRVDVRDIRAYTRDKHRNTDDYPFGGGAGMLMQAQPVCDAVRAADPDHVARRIYLSPRGRTLTQRIVEELAQEEELLLLCGHYEGVDERALELCIDEELSIGDYVLTGGELGALVVVDALARLLPGVLGSAESGEDESFTTGLLEYPQYTRPAVFEGRRVPEVLLGGNHRDITEWRRQKSLELTRKKRPELLETAPLTDADRAELNRMARADEMQARFPEAQLTRMDLFEEREYAKRWFAHFVPQEYRTEAKKLCFSGRRHVGYLSQAFEKGWIARADAEGFAVRGSAVLYLNAEGVALVTPCAEAIDWKRLPERALLTAEDFSATVAVGKGGTRYCHGVSARAVPLTIEGTVEHGKQLGRTLGFPTANIRPDRPLDLGTARGVYAARIAIEGEGEAHRAMMNIGTHPTLPEGAPTVEIHIFDYHEDIYDRRVRVENAIFLREERRFADAEALRAQLTCDAERAKALL